MNIVLKGLTFLLTQHVVQLIFDFCVKFRSHWRAILEMNIRVMPGSIRLIG